MPGAFRKKHPDGLQRVLSDSDEKFFIGDAHKKANFLFIFDVRVGREKEMCHFLCDNPQLSFGSCTMTFVKVLRNVLRSRSHSVSERSLFSNQVLTASSKK